MGTHHVSLLAMKNLSIKQKNNLFVGNRLATEIESKLNDCRAFIVIGAYKVSPDSIGGESLSKFSRDNKDALSYIRRYDVKKALIEADLYLWEKDLENSYYKKDIETLEELESELGKFIDDFSELVLEWECDNPV